MSKLFIRVNLGFYTHRKTTRLRAALGNDALWLPPRLWAYTAEHHPNGELRDETAETLAIALQFTGDAQAMLQALLQAGFLDDSPLRVHDWSDYNRYHQVFADRARKAAAARWSAERSKSSSSPKEVSDCVGSTRKAEQRQQAVEVLAYLNGKTGRTFDLGADSHLKSIQARLSEVKDDVVGVKQMIDRQCALWSGTEQGEYLRPKTLFGAQNFREYYDVRNLPVPACRRVAPPTRRPGDTF